jgi:alpha-beta hydrolase superfamily lysophospholipase
LILTILAWACTRDRPPADAPGRLIRAQQVESVPGIRVWQVLYHSRSVDNRPIQVSGLVLAPEEGSEPASRTVVAWGHGSEGLGDQCAPSRFPVENAKLPILRELVARGYVIAATDYEGLGTPGTHPWLVGQSEGRGMLDAVRAAGEIKDTGASKRFVALGVSQGGGAALFAGELRPAYAPDLELLGVVAVAPAAELVALASQRTTAFFGATVMGVFGFSAAYPQLPVEAILAPEVIAQRNWVENQCAEQIIQRFRGVPLELLRADPGSVASWTAVLTLNTPGNTATLKPVLVIHGDRDEVVPVAVSEVLMERLCSKRVIAELRRYPGADHASVIVEAQDEITSWIDERSKGSSAASSCR